MTELPSREEVASETAWIDKGGNNIGHWRKIVEAYASSELLTAAEWRDTIDYEAAAITLHEVSIEMAEGDTYDAARLVVDAAIGDTKPIGYDDIEWLDAAIEGDTG